VVASHPLHSSSTPGILCCNIHPTDTSMVATGGNDGVAILFNRITGKIVDQLKGHKKRVVDVKQHPTEKVVITASHDNTAIIWKTNQDGKYSQSSVLRDHAGAVVGVSIHPSGQFAVTAGSDAMLAFYDLNTATCRQKVSDPKNTAPYARVSFHPDGLILGVGTEDNLVRIFDVKQQKNVATFKGHAAKLSALTFSENGYYLASGDTQGVIKLWDLRKLNNFHTISWSEVTSLSDLAFDASGTYLATAGADIRLVATKDWDLVKVWSDHKDEVTGVQFGTNAEFFVSTSKDRTLKFFSSQSANSSS